MFSIGDYVWVKHETTGEFDIPKGYKIILTDKDNIQAQDDDGKVKWIAKGKIIKPIPSSLVGPIDDMIHLGDLQECAILRNLQIRFKNQSIYTYIGDMLVAVNPYQILNIYSMNEVSLYSRRKIETNPPHIFATSNKCFMTMKNTHQNQCILVSGESGAGKTESTKLILQYLTTVSTGGQSRIKTQILESNPILEAFGNAKTQRNDNSSRFGKYINIHFNNIGEIEGGRIDCYLLEKSRIVTQSKNERNYHIFYSMLEGLNHEEKQDLHLGNVSDYKYLQGINACKDRSDSNTFTDVKNSMCVLNYNNEILPNVIRLLAMILHLGNLDYRETTVAYADATEINDNSNLARISEYLGVSETIMADFLTKKSIFARGEQVVSNLSKIQAVEVRDAFAKLIYEKIFKKMVAGINKTIHQSKTRTKNSIGILDISGFENFDTNSFEQLCINYANEHLQQFFVQQIFKIEQEIYHSEGISWNNIDYIDNQGIIDLIGIKPLNIMSLIDEESIFPKGSDSSMLSKISLIHGNNSNFLKPKTQLTNDFGIAHFAGVVYYDVTGFLDKNRDICCADIKQLINSSTNEFFKNLFSKNEFPSYSDSNKRSKTLSIKFRESLDALMSTLHSCNPFFIRCIKPNENQLPKVFDRILCCRQLRYLGLMDTAKIRRAGYPLRYDYAEFAQHFYILARKIGSSRQMNEKYLCEKICAKFLDSSKDYRLGHSKVFLKDYQNEILENERSNILRKNALIIQKNLKMWIHRKRFLRMRKAVVIIQKSWRSRAPRKTFITIRNGVHRFQSRIRSRYQEVEYQKKRRMVISLQAHCRRHLVKKSCEEKRYHLKTSNLQGAAPNSEPENIDDIFDFLVSEPRNVNARKISSEIHADIVRSDVSAKSSLRLRNQTDESGIMSYDFYKFAAIYFMNNVTPQYSRRPLKQSLLELPHLSDELAAKALSITILRFMGDLPEPNNTTETYTHKPVMSTITESLSKNYLRTHDYSKFMDHESQRLLRLTLKKKNKLNQIITEGIIDDEYQSWLSTEKTNLEKLHFIIGHGILRPELKDEIYCQIVKQLINNPSKTSHAKGWVLLSLCIGCFAPSEKLINYLKLFIKNGPPEYAPFCEKRLLRTYKNGSRTQPPCWLEMQSVKYKEPITLKVAFADGMVKSVVVDSASTSQEIVDSLADSIKLKDKFGFSLFITIEDKVLSLGSERDHVMDAISQCEQFAKEHGHSERDAPWRLWFRKEIFSPWQDPAVDQIATNLIYHQICKGIKLGEYRCHNEIDLAIIIAQQIYIDSRLKNVHKNLKNVLNTYIPTHLLQINGAQVLLRMEKIVAEMYQKIFHAADHNTYTKTREDVVSYAKKTWPNFFSRLYEANKSFGPESIPFETVIAVNSTGVQFIDDEERILQQFPYPEISEVNFQKSENTILHSLTISTIRREEYVFQSFNAESFVSLVNYMIDGLKQRSIHVVAIQDYAHDEDPHLCLTLKRGDVIRLTDGLTGSKIMASSWASGEKNGIRGKFPSEYVYVLPILNAPSTQLLEIFKGNFMPRSHNLIIQELNKNFKESKYHVLKKFAKENFRPNIRPTSSSSGISWRKGITSEELWKHTREPMKAPLLANLSNKDEAFQQAVLIFTNILKYMGDLPSSNRQRIGTEYTDKIFEPALKTEILRDEVYCQIMRQLTQNRIRQSEDRGWELMWLATGIMTCSSAVRKELDQFLRTRDHPLVQDCLRRLNRITRSSSNRIHPPYIHEVEAVRFRNLQIFHKIYFPDGSDMAFAVQSSTKALDICYDISCKFQLHGHVGFSLFFKLADRMISVPQNYFFFDFIREVMDYMIRLKNTKSNASLEMKYQVVFMRKIWIDCLPGRDKNADSKFHFYQEAVKYLKGYHKCTKEDAIELGALIYISGHGDNKEELSQIHLKLQEYVPEDMATIMSPKEWKKRISAAHAQLKGLSQNDAKERFLQRVYQWPTFGSAFFDVRQASEARFPEQVIVAINKNGVSLIERRDKQILALFSYSEISNWSSGDTYFHMSIGNFMNGRKILCETLLGYKMDDLIGSYIDYLQGNMHRAKYNHDRAVQRSSSSAFNGD